MKFRFVAACAIVLLTAAGVAAQGDRKSPPVHIILDGPPAAARKAAPVNPNAPAKPAVPPAASKVDPNKPAVPAEAKKDGKADTTKDGKAGAKKKEDEIGKIEGMEIPRGNGFMGLQIVNGTFKLSFYDAKKKPVVPEVTRAALRWQPNYQKLPERVILAVADKALVSEKTVRPPYAFKLSITLFKGESDEGAENLTVDFSPGS